MKKIIITTIFAFVALAGFAQTKAPVALSQQEATQVANNLNGGLQIIHKLDIPALKRDSLDVLIGTVIQFIGERSKLAAKADTVKTIPTKKP